MKENSCNYIKRLFVSTRGIGLSIVSKLYHHKLEQLETIFALRRRKRLAFFGKKA